MSSTPIIRRIGLSLSRMRHCSLSTNQNFAISKYVNPSQIVQEQKTKTSHRRFPNIYVCSQSQHSLLKLKKKGILNYLVCCFVGFRCMI
mgnify:CR=1 FL=1